MIRNIYNQIPYPALKTKRKIIKLTAVTKGTRGKPNEQLFPRQVVIQLPKGRVIYYQLGGRLHFHVMYKNFYDPPNPTGKKSRPHPPRFMTEIFVTPQNSQYSSPQTQSFIFAININIATIYLKIVCLL